MVLGFFPIDWVVTRLELTNKNKVAIRKLLVIFILKGSRLPPDYILYNRFYLFQN